MPLNIELEHRPAGYAMNKARKGEPVQITVREFISTEDGDLFIERLEGLPQTILNLVQEYKPVNPSVIDNMLVIYHPDDSAEIYINELDLIIKTRVKKQVSPGDQIFLNDIALIEALEFNNATIPPSAGILFIFSLGWRKGMFYDLSPLHGEKTPRKYALSSLLGYYFAYLSQQKFFKINNDVWKILFEEKWFPFISLSIGFRERLISYAKAGWNPNDLLLESVTEIEGMLENIKDRWQKSFLFEPHMPLLAHALDKFDDRDYISSTSILYPRIEGVLRSAHEHLSDEIKINYTSLLNTSLGDPEEPSTERSLLLPKRFRQFMEDIYLADFVPREIADISRHSIAHGVAEPSQFDQKGAILGILILDHLYYFLPTSPF